MADGQTRQQSQQQTQDSDKRQVPFENLFKIMMEFAGGKALFGGLLSSAGAAPGLQALSGPNASPAGFGAIFGNISKALDGIAPTFSKSLEIGSGVSLMDTLMNLGNPASAPQAPQPQAQAPSFPTPSFGGAPS